MRHACLFAPASLALLALPVPGLAESLTVSSGDTLGAVVQSQDIDTFTMTGGTVQSLNQSLGYDIFTMSDGHIIGGFEDGDSAIFSGGRIGRVDLKLADNYFEMSQDSAVQTRIDGNLVSGFGNDTLLLRGGTIGGNISTSGGVDNITISGGRLAGNVLASAGNDVFNWSGGSIGGQVDMGVGDDRANIRGLDAQTLSITLDGGMGNDSLVFDNSQLVGAARHVNWEAIDLSGNSRLTLDDALVLGDPASGTGVLGINTGSTLISSQGTVSAFASGQRATLRNAGTIDLSAGNDGQGRLTIVGGYAGDGGTLRLASVLADDAAPSDRLVVSQGSITGTTLLQVANLGGAGAATSQNGIQVVEARDGALSTSDAFVQTQTLSVGAYDYRLFKGGVTAGSENSWYLRSTLVAPPVPAPGETAIAPPVEAPAPGQPDLPSPVAGQSLPLYRPEVPVYAAAPRGAAIIARQALGTFHQRNGDQQLLAGQGTLPASWGQAYGGALRQQWSGTVSPSLDGDLYGFKVGQDVFARVSDGGYRQQMGVYLSHARLDADVKGFALAMEDRRVGDLKLDGDSIGAYWTLVGPQRGYLDVVLQYTDLDGRARSQRGDKMNIDGHAWTASVESGYPIALSTHWTLEPQAQLIAQKVSLDSANDSVSHISHDAQVELTGRLGLRLEGAFGQTRARLLQPYVQVNLWHADGGRDTLTFDGVDRIKTDYRYTSIQLEGGMLAQLTQALSLHGGVQYSSNLDSRQQEASGVNLGARWQL
ncbi:MULTISPECIES: autotransporter outer membrane beta-barrel domain-containing protein [unclassified Pseudomonas]|uniref:autotransporter family protein n=1 Tax=unclassified Pseudomonas TaxID=196821 RepID=UPI002449DC9D|nr:MULTISPECIES: autotransporter outer membrane beta-barrel domain-containing protein [unclassified Pseudomonas]MDH0301547.1 autotransporter outer membrane beta-barrel domain-containing protein [Pseudomonas sp. GD04091]MDH1985441.1 autotransporter outer membrane beta-barrel domain-containing protein [Pseudomonas sp. GD03689]